MRKYILEPDGAPLQQSKILTCPLMTSVAAF